VRMIEVQALDLTAKGDAVDWLRAHPHAKTAEIMALPATNWTQSNMQHPLEGNIPNSDKSLTKFSFLPIADLKIMPID
jgi:hypothetical protein